MANVSIKRNGFSGHQHVFGAEDGLIEGRFVKTTIDEKLTHGIVEVNGVFWTKYD